jgi:hypothetical protein
MLIGMGRRGARPEQHRITPHDSFLGLVPTGMLTHPRFFHSVAAADRIGKPTTIL